MIAEQSGHTHGTCSRTDSAELTKSKREGNRVVPTDNGRKGTMQSRNSLERILCYGQPGKSIQESEGERWRPASMEWTSWRQDRG